MEKTKTIAMMFKERYMDHPAERTCNDMTESAKSMARKEVLEQMKILRANSIERDKILNDLSAALKKYGEIVK